MLYLLFEFDELLDTGGRAGGGMVFSPLLEITRLDKEGCSEDGLVEASKMESRVEDDFVLGPEPWERSESSDDFSVLKLAFDRLLRSLKKGIVPANPLVYVSELQFTHKQQDGCGRRMGNGEVEVASRWMCDSEGQVRQVLFRRG